MAAPSSLSCLCPTQWASRILVSGGPMLPGVPVAPANLPGDGGSSPASPHPAFPSAKMFAIRLLFLSLMQDSDVPKIRNKRERAEGGETLKHSRSNNWSKNSHFLHEGKKEENEASVSARFYLLNLCLFSIRDSTAIQSLFSSSQPAYQARPPQ